MAPQPGVNGVIPVTVLQKNASASAPRGPKPSSPRLKLVCRRLPPGLTKSEFEAILGEEWKVGGGKVDWFNYRKGKISKEYAPPSHALHVLTLRSLAKPSKPARAYLRVTTQNHATALGDHVREVTFHDAAKSFQDPALVGPPVLEFAPYTKMPAGRRRNDARQGTIDQDPEFKEFLESLTAPITKPAAPEGDEKKEEKVKTTPLIEALREKKANKENPKGKKGRGDKEDAADKKILSKKDALASGDKNRRLSKAEREKAQKEAVKAANKEAAASKGSTASSSTDKGASTSAPPATERKRGNVNLAKSMLQRDLGIGPAPNRRRGTKREVTPATQDIPTPQDENAPNKQKGKEAITPAAALVASEKTTPASPKKERPSRAERRAFKASLADKTNSKTVGEDPKAQTKPAATPAPTILKKPQQAAQTPAAPKGPAASRAPPTEPAAARNTLAPPQATSARPANPTVPASSALPTSTSTGKQAFLKHANASQGITEPLIEEALQPFGAIEKVEIDKRKGFAYVDFAEPEGLQKAIAASPVKVAQGAVQVLERKEKVSRSRPFTGPPTGPARGRGGFGPRGRGGRGGARGGGHVVPGASSVDAAPAPVAPAGGDAAT